MIIGEILHLFDYITFLLFILPLEWWSQPQINFVVKSIGGGSAQSYHQPWIQVMEGQVQLGIMEQAQIWGVN